MAAATDRGSPAQAQDAGPKGHLGQLLSRDAPQNRRIQTRSPRGCGRKGGGAFN